MFGALASIAQGQGKKALMAQAVLSAASTMIAGYEAAMKAAAEAKTIPGRIAAYAQFVGLAVKSAAQIRQAGGIGGGGGGGAAAAGTNAAIPTAQPERVIRVDFVGPDWARDMFQAFQDQLYENSRDGARVVFSR